MGVTTNMVRGMERPPKDVQVYGKCNQKCTCEIGKDSEMIENGMWFENEAHYAYYLARVKDLHLKTVLNKFQEEALAPLFDRLIELISGQKL